LHHQVIVGLIFPLIAGALEMVNELLDKICGNCFVAIY